HLVGGTGSAHRTAQAVLEFDDGGCGGVDDPRRDGVHGHPVGDQLHRQRPGQPEYPGLRGRVGPLGRQRVDRAGGRRQVHHPAPTVRSATNPVTPSSPARSWIRRVVDTIATSAPSAARRRAVAYPIPSGLPAPVTRATRPSSRSVCAGEVADGALVMPTILPG